MLSGNGRAFGRCRGWFAQWEPISFGEALAVSSIVLFYLDMFAWRLKTA
jgi:hypothetical protein